MIINIQNLPNVILFSIFKNIKVSEVPNIKLTCKQFNNEKIWNLYWKYQIERYWPCEEKAELQCNERRFKELSSVFSAMRQGLVLNEYSMHIPYQYAQVANVHLLNKILYIQTSNRTIFANNLTSTTLHYHTDGEIFDKYVVDRNAQTNLYSLRDLKHKNMIMEIPSSDKQLIYHEVPGYLFFQTITQSDLSKILRIKIQPTKNPEQLEIATCNALTFKEQYDGFLCCGENHVISCYKDKIKICELNSSKEKEISISSLTHCYVDTHDRNIWASFFTAGQIISSHTLIFKNSNKIVKLNLETLGTQLIEFSSLSGLCRQIGVGNPFTQDFLFCGDNRLYLWDSQKNKFHAVDKVGNARNIQPLFTKLINNKILAYNGSEISLYAAPKVDEYNTSSNSKKRKEHPNDN